MISAISTALLSLHLVLGFPTPARRADAGACPLTEDVALEVAEIPSGSPPSVSPDIVASYAYNGTANSATLDGVSLYNCLNDSNTLLATDGASVTLTNSIVYKAGYYSNLYTASFWGVNAAVLAANGSSITITDSYIESYIGGGGVYSYGSASNEAGTTITISNSKIFSNSTLSHGLYASANGTIIATDLTIESHGYRSSSLAQDTGGGLVYATNVKATTHGVGSAIFYATGTTEAYEIEGYAANAPILFMDGYYTAAIYDSSLTAGGTLGGMVLFCSGTDIETSYVNMTDTVFTTVGDSIPGIYVCNDVAEVYLSNVTFTAESGILVQANNSGIPQTFDAYKTPTSESMPGHAHIYNLGNDLSGDIAGHNDSYVDFHLLEGSSWTGAANTAAESGAAGVTLDSTSSWTLTADSYVQNLTTATDTLDCISSPSFTLYYNGSSTVNQWLANGTYDLTGGGKAVPW